MLIIIGETEIIPPKVQMSFESIVNKGSPLIIIIGYPGIHGDTVQGMQGPWVTDPKLAAIIAATAGLAGLLHSPNGFISKNGTLSKVVAIDIETLVKPIPCGRTNIGEGANPIVHVITQLLIAII